MKKTKLINSNISALTSNLGHTDQICLSDAGLPVPKEVDKIDLAVTLGLPKFFEVLKVISSEVKFEKVIIANEVLNYFPDFVEKIKKIFNNKIEIEMITHLEFKNILPNTRAVIRTGENKWFHNIILQSGVTF